MKIVFFLLFSVMPVSLHPQTWYLFSHGLGGTFKQAYKYTKTYKIGNAIYHNKRYIMGMPFSSFNYPDALPKFPHINTRKTSFAQNNEVSQLKLAVGETMHHAQTKEPGNHDIIIVGTSRGASAALNLMALSNLPMVKALVLESPFDSVASIIDNKRNQLHLEWLSHDTGELIMENIFRYYKRDGIHPIDLVNNIRKDLPILIICSLEDQLVPYQSSVKLYEKLKKSGHHAVHLLIVDHGKHSQILMGKDGGSFQAVVHAFYKKYGLPYDTTLAFQGRKYLH